MCSKQGRTPLAMNWVHFSYRVTRRSAGGLSVNRHDGATRGAQVASCSQSRIARRGVFKAATWHTVGPKPIAIHLDVDEGVGLVFLMSKASAIATVSGPNLA